MADGLVAALARCQAKFPPIVKSHTNPAFKGSQYADVADVLAAVRPVLAAEGIAVIQPLEYSAAGTFLVTKLLMGDEEITSELVLPDPGNPQQFGSLLTYMRRYQLCALLGVHPVGDDDDGNLAAASQPQWKATARPSHNEHDDGDTPREAAERAKREALPSVPLTVPEKPIAAMTVAELIAFARENGVTVSGSKSDMVRSLLPLVNAATGAEPFGLDAPAVTPVEKGAP